MVVCRIVLVCCVGSVCGTELCAGGGTMVQWCMVVSAALVDHFKGGSASHIYGYP